MAARRYTALDPEPHGTRDLTRYYLRDVPDMIAGHPYRSFGRPMVASINSDCEQCLAADARNARLRRMHTAYGRRSR